MKDGFAFDGWYTSAIGGNRVEAGDRINLNDSCVLYAHWIPSAVVTLTCLMNDGTAAYLNVKYYAGQTLSPMQVPTRSGYVFDGWYDAAERGNPVDGSTVISNDMTVYAHWTKSRLHKLEFDPNGGTYNKYSYGSPCYVEHGKTLQILPGSSKNGYVLDGWFTKLDGGEKLTTSTPITSDTRYYAHWTPARTDETTDDLTYSCYASWGNSSNSDADSDGSSLIFHPAGKSRQTAMLKVFFELNQAEDTILPVGSVKIKVPKKVFKNWYGSWTGTNNLSSNLPLYPNIRSGMLFSYIDEGDHYTLINNQELSGGAGVNITISYTADPRDIPGGAQNDDGEFVDGYDFYHETIPVTFSIDKDLDGENDAVNEKDLRIEMHTCISSSHRKESSSVLYNWNSAWGRKPADDDESFYVQWLLKHDYNNSSSSQELASFEWSEDTPHDGTVVYQKNGIVGIHRSAKSRVPDRGRI